uniref:F-box only protein 9 n=2 Tax=Lepeophtheirus salmonis TaxID=72036 RepID=A0A0K2V7V5_LEPSM
MSVYSGNRSVDPCSEEEQEEEDDDSNHAENELENFRQEWKNEVRNKRVDSETVDQVEDNLNSGLVSQATELFQQGVQCENNGDLYDAVKYYKKAFQLVPDIEKKTFDLVSHSKSANVNPTTKSHQPMDELEKNFSKYINLSSLNIVVNDGKICDKEFDQDTTHLSALPQEILIHILKWTVSDELDVHSLERVSSVCKGFYIASRSPVLWKNICVRTWGLHNVENSTKNWRDYFIRKPRVLPYGCYISKTTYMREGEKGFQDECYRAWHVVHYFRYIRFFASGVVLMAMSADPPESVVKSLKHCYWPPPVQGTMYGRFKIMRNKVVCVLIRKSEHKLNNPRKKQFKRKDSSYVYVAPEQEMHIEFEIKCRKNRRLEWSRYFIVSKYNNGVEKANEVDITNINHYPPFKFSPVTSYIGSSEAPL